MASSRSASPSYKIVFVASEAAPFAKTGGLADVVGALPLALSELGHSVSVIIPRYRSLGACAEFSSVGSLTVPGPNGSVEVAVEAGDFPARVGSSRQPVRLWAIRHDPSFSRDGLYQEAGRDYPDNLDRFVLFSRASIEAISLLAGRFDWKPDVLHAHDWQAALAVVYSRTLYAGDPIVGPLRSLFTVHNLGYQGLFPGSDFPRTHLPWTLFTHRALEFYGQTNLLKGGLVFSDLVSTVSPTYSREIQTAEFGCGLEGVLHERRDRLAGIVNGLDVDVWNPETDPYLPARYSPRRLAAKKLCKTELQREFGLPVQKVPMIGVVSRLSPQKGLDVVAELGPTLAAMDLQLVLLGTGDRSLEETFRSLHARYPDKIGLHIGFDEGLAHRIQAASDLFLVPSRYEPCGLTQLASLRYGTVPIARRTGGLVDTIVPYESDGKGSIQPTGFLFDAATPDALLEAIRNAVAVYGDRRVWARLVRAGMATDVSWTKSAAQYSDLYRRVLTEPRATVPG